MLIWTSTAFPALPSVLTDHMMSSNTTTTTASPTTYDYNETSTSHSNNTDDSAVHLSSIFNLDLNPMLDICTVDIPFGDSLPRDIRLLGLADMPPTTVSTTTTTTSTTFSDDSDYLSSLDFPVFHHAHINHRKKPSTPYAAALTTRAPFEEEDAAISVHPILPHHRFQRRRRPKVTFNPVATKRVVMTHSELMSALESMVHGQEESAKAERKFLEALSHDEEDNLLYEEE